MITTAANPIRTGIAIAGVGLALIAAATLWPLPEQAERVADTPLWCLVCGEAGIADVIRNLVLFVPLGFGLALSKWRIGRILAAALLVALTIESLQLGVIPGRDPSLSDVITNSTGGLAGGLMGRNWRVVLLPPVAVGQRLAIGAAATTAFILLLTGRLLSPSFPTSPWYGQLAPDLGNYERFPGTVVEVRVNGVPLSDGPLHETRALRERMLDEGIRVTARVITGPPTSGLAPVVAVFDERQRRILLLGQDGRALRFEVRLAADAIGLMPLGLTLAAAFPEAARQEYRLDAGFARGRFQLSAVATGDSVETTLALSPAAGWALIAPFHLAIGRGTRWLSMLWIALLAFPPGFWVPAASRSGRRAAAPAVASLLVAGLLLAPWAARMPAVEWTDLAGLVSGLVSGITLGSVCHRGEPTAQGQPR